jgi:tetratricopeptide (TPR) repeat protein
VRQIGLPRSVAGIKARTLAPGLRIAIRLLVLVVCVSAIREPYPTTARQAILRGDEAFQRGQFAQAFAEYQTALVAQPNNNLTAVKVIDSALAAGWPALAAVYLGQQGSLHGWTPALHRKMAEALEAQGDRLQAVAHWRASLIGVKDDISTLRRLTDEATTRRDWNAAIELLSRLIAIDPGDHHALYQSGLLLAPTEPKTALDHLRQASVDPQYRAMSNALIAVLNAEHPAPDALAFQVGLALMSARAWPYAEYALTIALDKGTSNPVALAFLGVAQDQQGRNGWPLLEKALAAAPNDPIVNYAVGLHWRLVGDKSKALDALGRAYALDPENPAIAAEIGLVYQKDGRLSEAAQWLTRATTLAPTNVGFRVLLATFYADSGYNLAGDGLATLRRLAEQSPNEPEIRASLGWALVSVGQLDAARVELEKALTLDPTSARARYYFGIFLENRGDREGAIDAYLYVYRDTSGNSFRDLAAGALRRLGFVVGQGTTSP